MPTHKIGSNYPTGRDYATLADWEAAMDATLSEPWTAECYNDGGEITVGEYSVLVDLDGHTTTPTNRVIITVASGHSFADHANKLTNALRYNPSNGFAAKGVNGGAGIIYCRINNVTVERLQLKHTRTASGGITTCFDLPGVSKTGLIVQNCILQHDSGGDYGNILSFYGADNIVRNCLLIDNHATGGLNAVTLSSMTTAGAGIFNCTIIRPTDYSATGTGVGEYGSSNESVKNCAIFGYTTATHANIDSGDYNATDDDAAEGANSLTGLTTTSQFESTVIASLDMRLKSGSSLINAGTPDATNATYDIVGTERSATTPCIGCWEYAAPAAPTFTPRIIMIS